jgi:hypothetical protein
MNFASFRRQGLVLMTVQVIFHATVIAQVMVPATVSDPVILTEA